MLFKILNFLGEWNPQLFRELKGRFKTRNILMTLGISLFLIFVTVSVGSENYCLNHTAGICQEYHWKIYWKQIFQFLNWAIPYVLFVGGVYQISNDLSKEELSGTLNFIRLTPQSSHNILLGKILGVPSLVYLGIGIILPLHFIAGIFSHFSLFWLLGIYTLWIAFGSLFYNATLLYSLMISGRDKNIFTTQSISGLAAILTLMLSSPLISILNFSYQWYHDDYSSLINWYWFIFPLGTNVFLAYSWLIITVLTASYWCWEAAKRRFNNPNKTVLSKAQSYGIVTSFQLWLLGFLVNTMTSQDSFIMGLMLVFLIMPSCFLLIIAAISPHRQTILDWARYRQQMSSANVNIWQDLIWGEKSPAIVALGVNLLITTSIWLTWILFTPQDILRDNELSLPESIFALFLTINIILIYGIIAQLMLMMKSKQRETITGVVIIATMVIPLVITGVLYGQGLKLPLFLAFSPLPITLFIDGSILTACLGLIGQILIIGGLGLQLKKQLTKAGESDSKMLLSGSII